MFVAIPFATALALGMGLLFLWLMIGLPFQIAAESGPGGVAIVVLIWGFLWVALIGAIH